MGIDNDLDEPTLPRRSPAGKDEDVRLYKDVRRKLEAEEKDSDLNPITLEFRVGVQSICQVCGNAVSSEEINCPQCGNFLKEEQGRPVYGSPPFLGEITIPPDIYRREEAPPAYGSPSFIKTDPPTENSNKKIIFIVVGAIVAFAAIIICAALIFFLFGVIFSTAR